jgi:hypothetical protein
MIPPGVQGQDGLIVMKSETRLCNWLLITECERREWILGTRARAVLHAETIYYKLSIWMEIIGVQYDLLSPSFLHLKRIRIS